MKPDKDTTFFNPGDIVVVKHDISDKPQRMWVIGKKEMTFKNDNKDPNITFGGIICRWFSKDNILQESIFNTKDLCKL